MTLQEFFNAISDHPGLTFAYFAIIPLIALWALISKKGEGQEKPLNIVYGFLVYLVSIPGIFAITLNVYLFLFERQSVMQMNILTQFLPILSMIATLYLINRNVSFKYVPGFDKLSVLLLIITALIGMMWIFDKTRIIAISYIPIHFLLLIFLGILFILVFGIRKLFSSE